MLRPNTIMRIATDNERALLRDIMPTMLPEIQVNDIVRLRKPHPCGGLDWKIYRLGADIGLECLSCGRRVLLPRRTLARRLKKVLPKEEDVQPAP